MTDLIDRLRDEADLCRNETTTDIANLLDEAAAALLEQRRFQRQANAAIARIEKKLTMLEASNAELLALRKFESAQAKKQSRAGRGGCHF